MSDFVIGGPGPGVGLGEVGSPAPAVTGVFIDMLHRIDQGMVTLTAAGVGGVLIE
jgi:hypothetical protein